MEVTDRLREVAEALADVDVHALPDSALAEALVEAHRAQGVLVAGIAKLTAAFDLRRAWAADGAKSAVAWLSHRCHTSRVAMRRQVRVARRLRMMPLTAAALRGGRVDDQHVQVLCRLAGSPRAEVAAAFSGAEEMLVGFAADLGFADFERAVAYWLQHADPDGVEQEVGSDDAGRFLHASTTFRGSVEIDGRLSPVAGAVFVEALERIESELFRADWADAKAIHGERVQLEQLARSPGQRRADALVEMAKRAMATPAGGRKPDPLVTVLVGYETFAGRICQLANGTVVTPGQVTPLLTEADVERVVFGSPSRVIDVGERTRFFRGALRRAIEVRDQRCDHPTCDTPAERCEIDHVQPYARLGPTDQENGRPKCRYHHRHKDRGAAP
jgi:hypothetical protein